LNTHKLKREAFLNMSEHLISFKNITKMNHGEHTDWIIADAYDLAEDKDLIMKFNLACMEAGMNKESIGFYQKMISDSNEYINVVNKVAEALKQMVDPEVKVILEKEFNRDDRSVISIQTPKDYDFS
jgi:hypothetical protein